MVHEHEDDGLEQAMEGQLRVIATAAAQAASRVMQLRREQMREREQQVREEAADVEKRIAAHRAVAHAELAPVHTDDWWRHATPEQIGHAWGTAQAFEQDDQRAALAATKIQAEVHNRYGFDVRELDLAQIPDHIHEQQRPTAQPAHENIPAKRAAEHVEAAAILDTPPEGAENVRAQVKEALETSNSEQDFLETMKQAGVTLAVATNADTGRDEYVVAAPHSEDQEQQFWRLTDADAELTFDDITAIWARQEAAKERDEAASHKANEAEQDAAAEEDYEAAEAETDPDQRADALEEADAHEGAEEDEHDRAEQNWDDAARHEALAQHLEERGVPEQARDARLMSERTQGRPATDIKKPGRSPKARRSRGIGGRDMGKKLER
ncbi:hypothetical protein M3D15_06870 [Pseudoclavibacter alba]|uniref:DUF3071 domain-containing protein n=1 Tax=Pseudoclavibacter albus TaxID=272241 RepID=A0ABT2HXK4_9MICO|nr:hypothetical protein [Pseudoclavibacter alba]MCT2043053.1 hypothetical protein [Pseudoclavibacter alba]